jgi:hypothetical protein
MFHSLIAVFVVALMVFGALGSRTTPATVDGPCGQTSLNGGERYES